MPSFTKKAIIASFLHLAGKKPLDKITVRNIVDDCGINRNTFYYYFQDIYAVLEGLCDDVIRALPQDETLSVTLTAFYRTLHDFAQKHPHTARSLALSLGFEGLERYFATGLDGVITDCYVRATMSVPSSTRLRMIRYALLGLCLDAMRDAKGAQESEAELRSALDAMIPTKPDKM